MASMTIGNGYLPHQLQFVPNTPISTHLAAHHYDELDRITFDFGRAPGLVLQEYVQDRENVFVVVKGKNVVLNRVADSTRALPGTSYQTQISYQSMNGDGNMFLKQETSDNLSCIWEIGRVIRVVGSNYGNRPWQFPQSHLPQPFFVLVN